MPEFLHRGCKTPTFHLGNSSLYLMKVEGCVGVVMTISAEKTILALLCFVGRLGRIPFDLQLLHSCARIELPLLEKVARNLKIPLR